MARLHSIHRGKAEAISGTVRLTAIHKIPVEGRVPVTTSGIEGDLQMDRRYHGGPFKALCAYCTTYYSDWAKDPGIKMPYGSFGENVAIDDLRDENVCVGDEYTIGRNVRVRVSGPRGPCRTLAAFWGEKDFHLLTKKLRRTGWYFSVLQAGTIETGDELTLLSRVATAPTIPEFWNIFDRRDKRAKQQIVALVPGLDPDWLRRAGNPTTEISAE